MANLKVVDADVLDANLTSVADKVREKAGTSEMLVFPDGYESALDSIESADSAYAEIESMLSNGYTRYQYYLMYKNELTEYPAKILQHISNGTDFTSTFHQCRRILIYPSIDTSKGKDFTRTFAECTGTKTIGGIDITNAVSVYYMFNQCSSLENITFNGVIKITGLDLSGCTKLTHDSLMSAINALYDWASEGSTSTYTLRLGSTNLAKLSDVEKAQAQAKGWTLS